MFRTKKEQDAEKARIQRDEDRRLYDTEIIAKAIPIDDLINEIESVQVQRDVVKLIYRKYCGVVKLQDVIQKVEVNNG